MYFVIYIYYATIILSYENLIDCCYISKSIELTIHNK